MAMMAMEAGLADPVMLPSVRYAVEIVMGVVGDGVELGMAGDEYVRELHGGKERLALLVLGVLDLVVGGCLDMDMVSGGEFDVSWMIGNVDGGLWMWKGMLCLGGCVGLPGFVVAGRLRRDDLRR